MRQIIAPPPNFLHAAKVRPPGSVLRLMTIHTAIPVFYTVSEKTQKSAGLYGSGPDWGGVRL